jgi:hypothetical protein
MTSTTGRYGLDDGKVWPRRRGGMASTTGRYGLGDGKVWRLGKTILPRILILMPMGLIPGSRPVPAMT